MMKAPVYQYNGTAVGDMELTDDIFNIEPCDHAIYQAVLAQRAHQRQGTHATRNRALVRGGGKKPFRQKGTGRARQGTSRAPHMVGGGRAFGPHPHEYRYRLPSKVRLLARKSALTYKAREASIKVLEDFALSAPKTKEVVTVLTALGVAGSRVLIVTKDKSDDMLKATRNLKNVELRFGQTFSTVDILKAHQLVFFKSAVPTVLGEGNHEESN
jgi:large subunit ribosomal protein L4